jgi:hypothetical protein
MDGIEGIFWWLLAKVLRTDFGSTAVYPQTVTPFSGKRRLQGPWASEPNACHSDCRREMSGPGAYVRS